MMRVLLVGIVFVFAALALGSTQGAPSGGDVPMFRGNPAHTGEHPGPGPEGTPALLWCFQTDGWVDSSPAVVDGVVYFGSDDGALYAVDAESGDERWRFQTGDALGSSPAVVEGVVYVGSGDGALYAVDVESGEERWRFQTETGAEVFSSPAVVDGVVYVGSFSGALYAVDAESGEERWRFQTERWLASSPAVVGGVIFFGSANPSGDDSALYAIAVGPEPEPCTTEPWGGGDPPEAVPTVSPLAVEAAPIALVVADQPFESGTPQLVVPEAYVSDQPFYVVVHEGDADSFGAVIGSTDLLQRAVTYTDVVVSLDRPLVAGEYVWPMLHTDDNGNGVYDDAATDAPIVDERWGNGSFGGVLVFRSQVTQPVAPSTGNGGLLTEGGVATAAAALLGVSLIALLLGVRALTARRREL